MTDMQAKTEGKAVISARVIRADGKVYQLGHVAGRFPWRVWLYRLRRWMEG